MDLETSRDMANRDRDRSRRGDKPSRFSDGNKERDRSADRGGKPSNNRVYVSNISYEYRWQDLKDLFRNQVGEVSFVELFVDENDKPKGCGIVEFSDPGSVKKCLEVMHRFDLKGRKLVIKEDFGTERDKYGNILNGRRKRERESRDWDDMRDRKERRVNMNNMFNRSMPDADPQMVPTWGLSPQFLESLGINRPIVSRIFIANLDYKVDEKKLREVFKLAGKIVDIDLYHDKDGKSRGCAVIDFDHPVESVQAISMFNDQILYDRPMTVRMDRMEGSDMPHRLPEGLKGIGMGLGVNGEPLKNVNQHLRSSNNSVSEMNVGGNSAAGILGAVPNLGSAAAALVNTPSLAGLANAQAALQGLTGVQNQFLATNLNELGLGNLNNSLMGNTLGGGNAFSALSSGNLGNTHLSGGMGGGNMGGSSNLAPASLMGSSNLGQSGPGMHSYNRGDNSNVFQAPSNQGMNRDYSSGNRDFDTTSVRSNYDMKSENDYRDDFRQQSALYTSANNGAQRRDSGGMNKDGKFSSDTVIVTNLSGTISWKMLREKFSSCGDVKYVESKSKETAIIRFANNWEAERAIQLLDRTRMDGRTIEVRFF